jgi:hypothetical protein
MPRLTIVPPASKAVALFYTSVALDLFVGLLNGQKSLTRLMAVIFSEILGFIRMEFHHQFSV